MSRVTGPLFSLGAFGTFAKLLTFRAGRRTTEVIRPRPPNAPTSPRQLAQRDRIRDALATWRSLTNTQRQDWKRAAATWALPTFALYLREWVLQQSTTDRPPLIPADKITAP